MQHGACQHDPQLLHELGTLNLRLANEWLRQRTCRMPNYNRECLERLTGICHTLGRPNGSCQSVPLSICQSVINLHKKRIALSKAASFQVALI